MTTTEYLGQLKNIDRRIDDKWEEAARWREIACRNQGIQTDKERVMTSSDPDKLGNAIAMAIGYEEEATELAEGLVLLRHHIIEQIDGMEDPDEPRYYNILKGYYLRGLSFVALGAELNYSPKQIGRDMKKAKDIFFGMYGEEYRDIDNMSDLVRHFRS